MSRANFDASFEKIFQDQRNYNKIIRSEEPIEDQVFWIKQYLLGISSEVDEVLREMKWKRHRCDDSKKEVVKQNLAYELADITKYVMSLWDVANFDAGEILNYLELRHQRLEYQYRSEFTPLNPKWPVIFLDLDGTVSDWRKAFLTMAQDEAPIKLSTLKSGLEQLSPNMFPNMILLDGELGFDFTEYNKMKTNFERHGLYASCPAYIDAVNFLHYIQFDYQPQIIVTTARPVKTFHRIWYDTYFWVKEILGREPEQLHFVSSERIIMARELQDQGFKVLAMDDDPEQIHRYHSAGIPILVRNQPYNRDTPLSDRDTPILRVDIFETFGEITDFIQRIFHGA